MFLRLADFAGIVSKLARPSFPRNQEWKVAAAENIGKAGHKAGQAHAQHNHSCLFAVSIHVKAVSNAPTYWFTGRAHYPETNQMLMQRSINSRLCFKVTGLTNRPEVLIHTVCNARHSGFSEIPGKGQGSIQRTAKPTHYCLKQQHYQI